MKRNKPQPGVGKGFCSCGAPVLWVSTPGGILTMLDPDPDLEGSYAIVDGQARHIRRKASAEPLYIRHAIRCPNGGNLRR